MSRQGKRPHIESALCLNLSALFAHGGLKAGSAAPGGWEWERNGQNVGAIRYFASLGKESGELHLNYQLTQSGEPCDVKYTIELSSRPLNFGGRYWYMHCPYNGRRARKLYKFPSIEKFCHRTSIYPLPTYASQRVSGENQVMSQRWAIRRKLGDNVSNLFGAPIKPSSMRQRTFERCRHTYTSQPSMFETSHGQSQRGRELQDRTAIIVSACVALQAFHRIVAGHATKQNNRGIKMNRPASL
ncbi:MAG: hypothetical protein P4L92_14905 [Rudaea sp.]|nr:hypothetical protein [Rudaea sp.]